MSARALILFFKAIDKHDTAIVGGKGANLGVMTQAGFPVPNGFAVTAWAYDLFLDDNDLRSFLKSELDKLDVADSDELDIVADRLHNKIKRSTLPVTVSGNII